MTATINNTTITVVSTPIGQAYRLENINGHDVPRHLTRRAFLTYQAALRAAERRAQ